MNNNIQHYDAGAGTQMVSSPSMGYPTLEPFSIGQPTRAMRRIVQRAEEYSVREKCKARIASEVIVNTMALSAICDYAGNTVPSSEPVCREATRVYAITSMERLGREC